MSRKLATVRAVNSVTPIAGADNIELAHIDGWQCVVKRGEFQAGSLCVYFEIDSVLPEVSWSEFLRPRKFRVKTIKLRGQLSQGLALSLETVFSELEKNLDWSVNADVTDVLGVKLYEAPGSKDSSTQCYSRKPPPHKWLLRFGLGRRIHSYLYPRASGSWPEWFPKTDEERVQNMTSFTSFYGKQIVCTEKLDGQSATYFYHKDFRNGLFSRGLYGICSRNVWKKCKDSSTWWSVSDAYRIEERLTNYCKKNNVSLAIQGEIVGPGVQGNKYGLHELHFFVFGIWDIEAGRYLEYDKKLCISRELGLYTVPEVWVGSIPQDRDPIYMRAYFLSEAERTSVVGCKPDAEGVVIRVRDEQHLSFKAISNRWLLKNEE